MKSLSFIVIETVNNHEFEHRLVYDQQLYGYENLPRDGRCHERHVPGCICFVNKLFASPQAGTFEYLDNDGDLRHYTWRMENG
jgi:hypothetical protein